ncbi:TonB-dependent receptor domain-containing protein [Kordiimonas sp. SCSIO 12610]|uniref:TonB-dependent receptor domain-containing protein n=1 Tax=Kordiimonas sp. SCSIO 12610 TaxID=2829597 RepID=UPI00210D9185|nr:TonB-dependent receptor [Kordiimonas sp. SCSIO 12610]UTW55750.1 TonB-dependent receptor [Kordiimonas sp. SCSIO 12610]
MTLTSLERNKRKRSKYLLSTAAIALFATGAGLTGASAQDSSANDDEEFEEVVVTGSRIKRDSNLTSPAPVTTLDSEQFRLSGEIDITDVLNDQPALLTSSSSEGSIDGIFAAGTGQAVLQLRGLGNERTLVLVDGRRHVSGVAGTQAVDINTIPPALIERVETLTGGASSIYGADAVTGVINFILKDDFEGVTADVQGSISDEGDGETLRANILYGKNFDDDRGNFTVAFDYSRRDNILFGDREFTRNGQQSDDFPNPALRFQLGDIDPTNTPNFAQFFSPANGRFSRGFNIPTAANFIQDFTDTFGTAPNLTAAEQALIDRAANAPARVILPQPTFSITSSGGTIIPADFSVSGLDVDGNGVEDCLDSFVGFNGLFDFSNAFGLAGGCHVANPDGSISPVTDGLIVGNFNAFGGSGVLDGNDAGFLTPDDERFSVNVTANYELNDNITAFIEAKFVRQEVESGGPNNTFYDLLTIRPDNPFIPDALQPVADRAGGLFVTRDPSDLGPNIDTFISETYRIVGGIEGEFDNGWNYELSANYGRFDREVIDRNRVIVDRFFAAIDATTDASGNAICRSDIDPTAPATTIFGIPAFNPGFFTFNPGDGSCRPANIFGSGNISQDAIDFITTTVRNDFQLEQFVLNGYVSGTTEEFLELPGGPIAFVLGAEYRDERSQSVFDPLVRGIAPVTTPDINAGQAVSELGLDQNALTFDSGALVQNSGGGFDVFELFGELSLPILEGEFLAEELRLDLAARYSEYSTIGSTFTWNAGVNYSPHKDIGIRASYSRSVRAPNIDELFSPAQAAFFRPNDPCDQGQIDALLATGDPRGNNRVANCAAAGLPAGFQDPLSARFVGETVGNPDLQEETADTFTVGVVLQPSFLDGLTISVDYWNIEISDAIQAPSAQDIVDACFDSSQFPNQFCDLFTRNTDTTSPQFGGFTFLRQQQVNFAALEAAGVDFQAKYDFDIDEHAFSIGFNGTYFDKLDNFFDPTDLTAVDPELGELQRPEWAGNGFLNWSYDRITVGWQTQYMDSQALRGVEIETATELFGEGNAITNEVFIHDINASYQLTDNVRVYGGVNNLTNKSPFITENAFPVSPRGRVFFLGVNVLY